ncbi:hypothetical protein IQ22_02828 [Pseudomonas duriflava]|uniref:Uncharacterized protein n=1 Tax=Pseudomonas duriflava TaxID=459528 RepID=A0A562Q8C7_9PSED|nr:hypothetical protein [Pseudomonas duriflava]TWI52993.1 hypothetical protein IQ22_02828 [Pseudomonas duriflava]
MGIKIISRGTVAPWYSKVIPPVTRGIEGWFTFDTDASRFSFNRAIGKNDASIVGAPTAFATHGRFKSLTNFIQTQIGETAAQTLIVVCRAANPVPAGASGGGDANTPFFVGNYYGTSQTAGVTGNAFGVNVFSTSETSITGTAAQDNGSGAATAGGTVLSGDTPTNWAIRGVRADTSGTTTFNSTRGTSAFRAATGARVLSNTKFRIGSATTAFAAEADISAVAIYSVALTDAEIAQVALAMRKRMARLGIAV